MYTTLKVYAIICLLIIISYLSVEQKANVSIIVSKYTLHSEVFILVEYLAENRGPNFQTFVKN